MSSPLVSAEWLVAHLDDPDIRVADVRWYLADPARGRRQYRRHHVPGAVFLDLEQDLSAPHGDGRHPLPEPARFAARLGELGLGDGHLVVAYDDAAGAVAARLWWMLLHLGHEQAAVLDGGYAAWRDGGLPTTAAVPKHAPARFTPRPRTGDTVARDQLRERLGSLLLLDARAPERYRGDVEDVDPIAGHIPTAVSAPYAGNTTPHGRFLPAEVLAHRFRDLGARDDGTVVHYCGSGVTACHNILAMHLAGLTPGLLYPGSWSDWSTAGYPSATGAEPGPALG